MQHKTNINGSDGLSNATWQYSGASYDDLEAELGKLKKHLRRADSGNELVYSSIADWAISLIPVYARSNR